MRTIRPVSEEEMISVFLRAEISSSGMREHVLKFMEKLSCDDGIIYILL